MAQEAVVMEPKAQAIAAARPSRRPAEKPSEAEAAVRYFLAGSESNDKSPSLGRELVSENEALIESLKMGVSFYAVSEYRAIPDMTGKAPLIRKEAVKRQ